MQLAASFWGLREGEIAGKIFKIYNKHFSGTLLWAKRLEAFEKIFTYYTDNPPVKMKYFYYDMHTNTNLFLNGQKKESMKNYKS